MLLIGKRVSHDVPEGTTLVYVGFQAREIEHISAGAAPAQRKEQCVPKGDSNCVRERRACGD
jgi:hypothetical protein